MSGENSSLAIGVVGFGRMGRAIATRLVSEGSKVSAWSRGGIADEVVRTSGVTPCAGVSDLIEASDLIMISVLDDAAVFDVLAQVCDCDLTGKLIVETSTVRPDTLAGYMVQVKAKGGQAIDAPISGGPDLIAKGEAGLYVGGDERDVERFMPTASVLSNRVVHVGALGAGYAAKIVNNMMLAGFWQTLKEASQVGRSAGLSMETMIELLSQSPAANAALKHRAPVILGTSEDVGFSVSGAIKDVSLFADVARNAGVDTPAINAALESFRTCRDAGHSDADLAVMVREAART